MNNWWLDWRQSGEIFRGHKMCVAKTVARLAAVILFWSALSTTWLSIFKRSRIKRKLASGISRNKSWRHCILRWSLSFISATWQCWKKIHQNFNKLFQKKNRTYCVIVGIGEKGLRQVRKEGWNYKKENSFITDLKIQEETITFEGACTLMNGEFTSIQIGWDAFI